MDWYGRRLKIVRSIASPKSAASLIGPEVRFERFEFVWMRLINSQFQPI